MVRRHTEAPLRSSSAQGRSHGRSHVRSNSLPYVDMNLAYGDLPSAVPMTTEVELRGQMSKLTHLLDEANCLQHSVTTMIETLQRDPERLAAVGLALAEISTLVRGMAPGVLMAMKGSFPAAAALLASPQFLIAAGVGVGVTIVALGGYKIIKRIKARHDAGDDLNQPRVEELREIGGDLSRIEIWRRGIAEFEVGSAGTSVDGEFITPDAGRQMTEAGVLDPRQVRPATSVFEDSSRRKKDRKKERTSAAKASGKHSSPLARTKSERSHSKGGEDSLITRKRKELSGLKMLFSK